MRIRTQDYNNITVIEMQGEFEADCAEQFRSTITSAVGPAKNGIILDMTNVSFIDSKALEELLWSRDYCIQTNRQLKLAGLDETCEKILELTRLREQFERFSEPAEAVKSFA